MGKRTQFTSVMLRQQAGNGTVGLGFSTTSGSGGQGRLREAWEDSDEPGWIFMRVPSPSGKLVVVRVPRENVASVLCAADNDGQVDAPPPAGKPGDEELERIRQKRDAALAEKQTQAAKPVQGATGKSRRKAAQAAPDTEVA